MGRPEKRKRRQRTEVRPGGRSPLSYAWIVVLALGLGWFFAGSMRTAPERPTIPYSVFKTHVTEGRVVEVTLQGDRVEGRLERGDPQTQEAEDAGGLFVTHVPDVGDPALLPALERANVTVAVEPEEDGSLWIGLLNLLPFLLLVWIGFSLYARTRSQGTSLFNVRKSRAKWYDGQREKIGFDDVAGVEGAKRDLEEIVSYLKDPSRFQKLGAKTPKGLLLVGPPGTGKTLLARAVAGEAEVPFMSITGSDFMEMFVGVGASRVRGMFSDAKKQAPSIIFIDELDSIGRRRGAGLGGGHDEREQTLNQMLSELDGFEPTTNVLVIAATNRPDILDPALLRPGRFDRQVTVDLPTYKDRVAILRLHARSRNLEEDVDLERAARRMPGSSGADLENMLNEAAMMAARAERETISQVDLEEAMDRILLGMTRDSLVMTEAECRTVAYHESGHALLAAVLDETDPVHKVSVVPRERSMGVTHQVPDRDRYLHTKAYLEDRLCVMMGGRAAEAAVNDSVTSGAENDLKEATRLARRMVVSWGMSKETGNVHLASDEDRVFLGETLARGPNYSDSTAHAIDEAVRGILDTAYERAEATLEKQREALDRLATALMEKEELSGEQVLEIVGLSEPEAATHREASAAVS